MHFQWQQRVGPAQAYGQAEIDVMREERAKFIVTKYL